MRVEVTTRTTGRLMLGAALSLLGAAVAQADVPGYLFIMMPEQMMMVIDKTGKETMARISDDAAKMITAGAQPLSGSDIVVLYQGKVYVVPDKRLGDGRMMSATAMSSAPKANK